MASTLSRMRPLEERQVEQEVKLLQWSPKMDILAVGFLNGDVSLHRLNWQKIWTVSPPEESACEAIVWRPDGQVVAIGYSNGEILILNIENNVPIHINDAGTPITCMSWVPCEHEQSETSLTETKDTNETIIKNNLNADVNEVWSFLTQLPSLSKAYSYNPSGAEDIEDCQKLLHGNSLSILVVGTKQGFISVFMNGFLHCTKIDMNNIIQSSSLSRFDSKCHIKDVVIAPNLTTISVLYTDIPEDCQNNSYESELIKLMVLSMPLISSCVEELSILSTKFSVVEGMMNYMSDTLKQISEAWEEILLEMDIKLASYASKLPKDSENGGTYGMAADFLELLTFGMASPELEAFLLQELTEKGLKKLGHSIDVSYSNVQRLVLKYLHTASQSLNFHLAEMMGQVKASDKYGMILGISAENIINAQQNAASFWNKGIELQQVIDDSMKSFKAFFRWLYVEILRLSDEDVSEELSKVSQQDISFIADFLSSFAPDDDLNVATELEDNIDKEKNIHSKKSPMSYQTNHHKSLERVGQYLKDENLKQPVDRHNNPWHDFLKQNPEFNDVPFIIQVNEKTSLIQEYNKLNSSIRSIFSNMTCDMTEKCTLIGFVVIPQIDRKHNCLHKLQQFSSSINEEDIKVSGFVGMTYEEEKSSDKMLIYELTCPMKTYKGNDICKSSQKHSLRGIWLGFEKFYTDNDPEVTINSKHLNSLGKYNLVDCKFYTNNTVSILLNDNYLGHSGADSSINRIGSDQNQRMIQFSVSDAEVHFRDIKLSGICQTVINKPDAVQDENSVLMTKSIFEITGQACHRELEKIASIQFAVSGPRNVAAFLFENKKRVRIYDMEADELSDEEDEENENMGGQSSGLSSSELNTSEQDNKFL